MQRRSDEGRLPSELPSDRHPPVDTDVPLVIDAETTVWRGSLLLLAISACLKASALNVISIGAWMFGGRCHLERELAQGGVSPNVVLPLDRQVAAIAEEAVQQGRSVYLAAPAGAALLQAVAARHPAITEVIVAEVCETGTAKATPVDLASRFPQGFDLVTAGHGIDVVRHPRTGLTCNGHDNASASGSEKLPAAAIAALPVPFPVRELARSLRLHQCVKNLIVFVPIVLGGRLTDISEVISTLVAFVALSCIASGTYLINDIWDIAEDRQHWSKRYRPIAAGRLAAATALGAGLGSICAGVALGFLVSWMTGSMLLLYLGITLAYTFHLKTVAFVDGLVLATLFTVRLGIGAVAANVPPSPWLFVFSMFLFASLSYAKRHTELVKAMARKDTGLNGRGYRTVDAPMMLTVGLSSGIGAVMIMVLYIVEEAFRNSFYGSTGWLWGFPPLVFLFVVRVWLLSARGEMSDDPVAFAIKDPTSLVLSALLMLCFGFAWLG